jgi:pyruvate dehydrogenase kinase 2/3/4
MRAQPLHSVRRGRGAAQGVMRARTQPLRSLRPRWQHTSGVTAETGAARLDEAAIRHLASQAATPISLRDLYTYGCSSSPAQQLRNAQFLHRELPIRMAQRVAELQQLPYGLSEQRDVRDVLDWYTEYTRVMALAPRPETEQETEAFTKICAYVLQDHQSVVEALSMGVLQLRRKKSRKEWTLIKSEVDAVLDRFYMARIGLRFLLEHHVSSSRAYRKQGRSGIIESEMSPLLVAEQAAAQAQGLCTHHLGDCPPVEFHCPENLTLTYVPMHLHYMLFEVLKNACRASTEHCNAHNLDLQARPIKVVIADGREDIAIKVSDEGGGIRRSEIDDVWTYLHSTAPSTRRAFHSGGAGVHSNTTPLAGFGVGLPLSRLYARYFGGDLQLLSMEGFGTDGATHQPKDLCSLFFSRIIAS